MTYQIFSNIIKAAVLNLNTIKEEVEGGRGVNSEFLNKLFKKKFKTEEKTTKAILIDVWKQLVEDRPKPRKGRTLTNLLKHFNILIKTLYPNTNTSEMVFSNIRKPIKEKFGADSDIYTLFVNELGLNQEESLERKQQYNDKVKDKNLTRRELEPIYVEDVLEIIKNNINSADVYKKILAVMLATGSRGIEVVRISNYEKEDNKTITITGVGKGKSDVNKDKTITKPLIQLNSNDLLNAIDEIRTELDFKDKSYIEITNKINARLNNRVKKIFNRKDITSHKMRYIAGQVAYILYGDGAAENAFIQGYLGHNDGSTTRTYQSINVQLKEKEKGLERITTKIEQLKVNDEKQDEEIQEISKRIEKIDDYNEELNGLRNQKKPKLTKDERFRRLKRIREILLKTGTNPTYTVLSKYGYGNSIISEFFKKLKKDEI